MLCHTHHTPGMVATLPSRCSWRRANRKYHPFSVALARHNSGVRHICTGALVFNHHFWCSYFRREFVPQLQAIVEVLEKRTLPAFSGIEQEAERVSAEAWDAFMSALGTGDEDPSEFAEATEQAAVSHYMLLDGIRQGMVNLFAAALYHAFEQQVMLFLRREVLDPREENNPKLFHLFEFQKRLKVRGLDVTSLASWGKVDELRLVANTVKHAEGESAQKLHELRPDMFERPQIAGIAFASRTPRVFQPLVGEDLYVSLDDVREYRDSVVNFWQELSDAMERA